jgi:hypothetical protein
MKKNYSFPTLIIQLTYLFLLMIGIVNGVNAQAPTISYPSVAQDVEYTRVVSKFLRQPLSYIYDTPLTRFTMSTNGVALHPMPPVT